ncbi:ATP-binding cassette domain-containing protein [Parasulfitobacter algicola]|uniref:ATP-binding cassette domain-containing protein n=1 Tax=Parasulfitobacter algicola TaxID=2614809 RepID=A0ABX2IPI7_9RHOB|nr:ATP-binding cassette domain-containing protein [Sulfitobacter algicola]NSX54275.1 ATP-binding cassette domain-containing protein [Sulfitobacter algicola]
MLTFENLHITIGDFELRGDIKIETGAQVAIMGPSGAGKSTLFNAVAGFLSPSAGRIVWDGQNITTSVPADRPIALLFQDNNLFPHLTAFQNTALGIRPDLRLSDTQSQDVTDALAKVGLQEFEARKPAALSGGQQSRVALARVLVQHKPLILLDEPFAALGPALKAEMLDLLSRGIRESGGTLLMITHDPADAKRIADSVIIVADGQIAAPVETVALFENPPAALQTYLG